MVTFILLIVACIVLLLAGIVFAFPLVDLAVFVLICYGIYKLTHMGKNHSSEKKSSDK